MAAADSFVGDGLNPSPYKEALARAERAEAELAEWRDGDHQHPLTVHGYKIMVRHLTDERRKAEAERDRYHDALIARHGGEPIALLSELDEARAERDALRALLREAREREQRYVLPLYRDANYLARIDAVLARVGSAKGE